MFMSVWYAKKMGCRFLNNVRKGKKRRHHKMVGMFLNMFTSCLFVCMTPPQHSCTDFNENVTGTEYYISVFCYLNILKYVHCVIV